MSVKRVFVASFVLNEDIEQKTPFRSNIKLAVELASEFQCEKRKKTTNSTETIAIGYVFFLHIWFSSCIAYFHCCVDCWLLFLLIRLI